MIRKWGWKPDIPDQRDFAFKRITRLKVIDKIDLRLFCPKVEDQEDLGSCTANAGVGLYEFVELKQKTEKPFWDASRLFLYYNTRVIEGTVNEDSGAYIRDTMKALAKYGVCPEKEWPYIVDRFADKPPKSNYTHALKHKALTYRRLETLEDMLGCLADGFPFEFGFAVYESFQKIGKSGIMLMPKKTERLLGGHAVMAVGYDQKKKWLIVRNSWGEGWGDKGYFYMPFAYATNRNLSDDFWVVRKET
jgi:C1A family cysteine protease